MDSERLKVKARELGFDLCGISAAGRYPRLSRLAEWLAEGRAGDMHYLSASLDERLDPASVLPGVRSIISVACLYNSRQPYSTEVESPERALISRYCWGDDYHDIMRARLRALVVWLAEEVGPGLEAFSCVDNGPVQERALAEQAGLGWIGKNTCLINASLGSWLFLGEVLTNLDLAPDRPAFDQCGSCTRCLEACPTGAIVEPYTVDATKCLAYLTIETRAPVAVDLRASIGPRIAGCDVCQDVCPWNRRAAASPDTAWEPRPPLGSARLLDLCELSDEAWRALLEGSALRRAGLRRIRRSLAYAAAGLPAPDRQAALAALASHPSSVHADVREAVEWAAGTSAAAGRAGC
jgi:epoxyqueuosine reductase